MKKEILVVFEFISWCLCILFILFAIAFGCVEFILLSIIGFCVAAVIHAVHCKQSWSYTQEQTEEKQDILVFILWSLKNYYKVAPYMIADREYSLRGKIFIIDTRNYAICFKPLGIVKHLKQDVTEQELFKWLDDCENLLK